MKSNHFVNSKLGRSLNIGSTSFQRTDRNIYPAGPSAACPVAMVRIGAAGLRAGNDLALISASPVRARAREVMTYRTAYALQFQPSASSAIIGIDVGRQQHIARAANPVPSCRHSFRASSDRCPNGASRRPAPNRYPTTEPDRAESSRPESACRRGADRPQYTAPWLRTESPTR